MPESRGRACAIWLLGSGFRRKTESSEQLRAFATVRETPQNCPNWSIWSIN